MSCSPDSEGARTAGTVRPRRNIRAAVVARGLPIALLEALSFGLQVIASDIPANVDLGLPSEHCVPVGDVDALAGRLRGLVVSPSAENADERVQRLRRWLPNATIGTRLRSRRSLSIAMRRKGTHVSSVVLHLSTDQLKRHIQDVVALRRRS